jgi:hypothetical protein
MHKDFTSSLFETPKKVNTVQSCCSKDFYAQKENLTNLNYIHPITVTFDKSMKQPKVFTQMIYADDRVKRMTPLLPWNLPNDLKKPNYYGQHHEINQKLAQYNQSEFYYFATCKSTRAKFFPSLLNKCKYCIYFLTSLFLNKTELNT